MASLSTQAKGPDVAVKIPGYPGAQGYRGGIKVAWLYYADKAKAYQAATTAKGKAGIVLARGGDFGYQVPGTVTLMQQGGYSGLYEVCIP